MENLEKSLEQLQEAIDASYERIEKGPLIRTTDLLPEYLHLFNAEAQVALDKPKATSLSRQILGTMETEKIHYFAVRVVGKHNIPKAAQWLISVINRHALLGQISCFLTPLGFLELSCDGFDAPTDSNQHYAVYTYPMFNEVGYKAVEDAKYEFVITDGQLVPTISDPAPAAPEGIATHIFEIALVAGAINCYEKDAMLEQRKKILLQVLPQGTECIAIDQGAILTLAIPFRFTLKHPYFKAGTRIELDYMRAYWPDESGSLSGENLLTGVRYLNESS